VGGNFSNPLPTSANLVSVYKSGTQIEANAPVNLSVKTSTLNSLGASSTEQTYTVAFNPQPVPYVQPGQTVTAQHILGLRQAVNRLRAFCGMDEVTGWAAENLKGTPVMYWSKHILDIRQRIEEIRTYINGWDTANSVHDVPPIVWMSIPPGSPGAAVYNQVIDVLKTL